MGQCEIWSYQGMGFTTLLLAHYDDLMGI